MVDLLSLEKIIFSSDTKDMIKRTQLNETTDEYLWEESKIARSELIDTLSGLDDDLANTVISCESLDDINTTDIVKTLRNVTLEHVRFFYNSYHLL